MYNYLVSQALETVYSSPGQDKQFNIELNRLSPIQGYRDAFYIEWNRVTLPKEKGAFHVFNIGQHNPRILGLLPSYQQWMRADILINKESILFSLINEKGIQFPRHRIYYQLTKSRDILIALEESPWMEDELLNARIYLHVYSNALRYSERNTFGKLLNCQSTTVMNRDAILTVQRESAEPVNKGKRFFFVNGRYVDKIALSNTIPGDDVEYLTEFSVKKTITFHIPDLSRFDSTIDRLAKFLITYPNSNTTIDYHDDIEVYVYKKESSGAFKGAYLHRNDPRTMRNLTHADYSIAVNSVTNILQLNGFNHNNDCYIELNIRHAGFARPLVQVENRIHDLYRLSYANRVRAMIGPRATVSVWKAANLEASAYPNLMRYKNIQLPQSMVEDMYGHHMGGKLLANTPQPMGNITGAPGVRLPYLLGKRSTIYEYDAQGLFIKEYLHDVGENYLARNARAAFVEAYKGYGNIRSTDVFNQAVVPVPAGYNFRCYKRPRNPSTQVPGKWKDVTNTQQYLYQDGEVRWITDSLTETLVRFNNGFIHYEQQLDQYMGNYVFTLMEQVFRDNLTITQPMEIPREDLDVWLNGHSLVEGVDFIVRFPSVTIISTEYLDDPGNKKQRLVVRSRGFCSEDMEHKNRSEIGFVSHGLVSHNHRVNLRRDRVVRVSVKGKLRRIEDIVFPEDSSGTVGPNIENGNPYAIRDEIIPVNEVMDKDAYMLFNRAEAIDEEIEDYLTKYLPKKTPTGPNIQTSLHGLYSPFINAVFNDLHKGILRPNYLLTHYNDDKVRETLKPYEYLLAFDPTQHGSWVDRNYTLVQPHLYPNVIEVPIHEYAFMQRAIDIYMKDQVILNHSLAITDI